MEPFCTPLCMPHATVPQIKQVTGLDADTLAQQVMDAWMKGENIS